LRILVVSPHTDDAELGAGGSIVRFLEEGHSIMWIVFSIAEETLPKGYPPDTLKKEFLAVVNELNIDTYKIFNFRVRHLHEHRQEILEELVKVRNQYNPDLVIGPSLNDFHQDHQVVANEIVRAFKMNASIINYELPWNHVTFNTQLFVKLEKRHIDKKINLLSHYKSQIILKKRRYFNKEFIYGWARTHGVQCNAEYAEAFEVIRWIL